MWCPEGYVTLGEIGSQFMWDSDLIRPSPDKPNPDNSCIASGELDRPETKAFSIWTHAAFFKLCSVDVRACLPSGAVVRLAPEVFWTEPWWNLLDEGGKAELCFPSSYADRLEISKLSFTYIDTLNGCIDCGWMSATLKDSPIFALHGSPLCIEETKLPVRRDDVTKWVIAETARRASRDGFVETEGKRSGAQEIVQAFQTGRVRTKPEARGLFGRNMKHEAWLALWREACEIMPGLARPGPRFQDRGRDVR